MAPALHVLAVGVTARCFMQVPLQLIQAYNLLLVLLLVLVFAVLVVLLALLVVPLV